MPYGGPPAQRSRGAAPARRRAAVRRLRRACPARGRRHGDGFRGRRVSRQGITRVPSHAEDRHAPEAQHPRNRPRQARRLRLGRPLPARRAAERGGAAGPRRRPRLRRGPAGAADPDGAPHRELRPGDHDRDGRPRPARPDHPRGLRRRRRLLRRLRPDRPRGRARRLGLPLGDERAVEPGHAPDLRLRHRRAAREVPAEARQRRVGRRLRADRARPRLRPRRHGHPRPAGRRRLQLVGRQDLDHQRPDRRPFRHLGQVRRPRRQDQRLPDREGRRRPLDAEDRGQVLPARLGHRHDPDGLGLRPRGEPAAARRGPRRPVRLPQPRPLRHRLGVDGRGRVLLARRPRLYDERAASSAGRSPRPS